MTSKRLSASAAITLVLVLVGVSFAVGPTANAAPIVLDLNTFSQKGAPANGDWVVNVAGDEVVQNVDSNPTYLVSPDSYRDTRFRGFITTPAADDDFFGVVVDHQNPSSTGDLHRTVVVDWKGATQTANGYTANEGFTVTRYDGTVNPTTTNVFACFWGKVDADCPAAVTVLGSNHAAGTGWLPGTTYEVSVRLEENLLRVFVSGGQFGGGQAVVDITTETFPSARQVGLYTFHQSGVKFHGWNIDDFIAPALTIDASCPTPGDNGWCRGPVETSASATDLATGVASLDCTLDAVADTCATTSRGANGVFTFAASATDGAGNVASDSVGYMVDDVDPVPTIQTQCANVGAGGYCGTDVRVRGLSSDATSGIATRTCTLDGTPVSCGFRWITTEGMHTYTVDTTDKAGNTASATETILIDLSAPAATAKADCTPWYFNGWCQRWVTHGDISTDTLSGVAARDCFLNGISTSCATNITDTDGFYTFNVTVTDGVGHANSTSVDFKIDSTKPTGSLDDFGTSVPLLGTVVMGAQDLTVTADDALSGVHRVEYWIDGWHRHTSYVNLSDPNATNVHTWTWDSTGEADGFHEVQVRILDVAGNFLRITRDVTSVNGTI